MRLVVDDFLGYLYNDIENKVLLIGIVIRKIEVIFFNLLDVVIISFNYNLFFISIFEMLCSYVYKEVLVLIEYLCKL